MWVPWYHGRWMIQAWKRQEGESWGERKEYDEGERAEVEKERWKKDSEIRSERMKERKRDRKRKRREKILVGRREMKRGLLWFRRWPVVTSSRLGSTARFEQERDRGTESERERRISRGTGSILLASCGGCYTSETLHLASSEGTVWACSLSAIRPCTFDSRCRALYR